MADKSANSPSNLLSPQGFLEQLEAKLVGCRQYLTLVTDEYEAQVRSHGSEKAFASANRRHNTYLEGARHITGTALQSIVTNVEFFAEYAHRFPKDEYLTHGVAVLTEIKDKYAKYFKEYPEHTYNGDVLKTECASVLEALNEAIVFTNEQLALNGKAGRKR